MPRSFIFLACPLVTLNFAAQNRLTPFNRELLISSIDKIRQAKSGAKAELVPFSQAGGEFTLTLSDSILSIRHHFFTHFMLLEVSNISGRFLMQSAHNHASSRVRAQYEALPYPHRNPQDEANRRICTLIDNLDAVNHYCFGGRCDVGDQFRVLVAGGGTGDAVLYLAEQLRHTDAAVTYIDLSRESMQVAQQRATVCGLQNIQWIHGSLLDLPDLDLPPFDYINCSGVLHHLEHPEAGLRALQSVLKDDGALALMLYGKYGRTAVYQIQDLMRLVNSGVTDVTEQIANTQRVLEALPANHWYNLAIRGGIRMQLVDDADYLDTFLHNVDRAYTVPELYGLLDSTGLYLAEFNAYYRHWYRPEYRITDPRLQEIIGQLPLRDRRAIGELTAGVVGRHEFYATRTPTSVASFDDLENVPFFSRVAQFMGAEKQLRDQSRREYHFKTGASAQATIPATPFLRALIKNLDGRRTIGEIIDDTLRSRELGSDWDAICSGLNSAYQALNLCDVVLLRHRNIASLEDIAAGKAA